MKPVERWTARPKAMGQWMTGGLSWGRWIVIALVVFCAQPVTTAAVATVITVSHCCEQGPALIELPLAAPGVSSGGVGEVMLVDAGAMSVSNAEFTHQSHEGFSLRYFDQAQETATFEVPNNNEVDWSPLAVQVTHTPTEPGLFGTVVEMLVTDALGDGQPLEAVFYVVAPSAPLEWMFKPPIIDAGPVPAGTTMDVLVSLYPKSGHALQIVDIQFADSQVQAVDELATLLPFDLNAGGDEVTLRISPTTNDPQDLSVHFEDAHGNIGMAIIRVNDCLRTTLAAWDNDNDGFRAVCGGDCDDTNSLINPAAYDAVDGIDNNCDGQIDEVQEPNNVDHDGDGYCGAPSCVDGSITGDCHPTDPSVFPGAVDVSNGRDDDCDGLIDEDTIYVDLDGDGFTSETGDCDDADLLIGPWAHDHEPADGTDNDCDGLDGEDPVFTWTDNDSDGAPAPLFDCDDENPDIRFSISDTCDQLDNDCDGETDEDCDPHDNTGCTCNQNSSSSSMLVLAMFLSCVFFIRRKNLEITTY